MRILFDTNVLVAASISAGSCRELVEHCLLRHVLLASPALVAELQETLCRKLRVPLARTEEAVRFVREEFVLLDEVPALAVPVCRDPDDDAVLSAAAAGGCRCIVTGDKDLLELGSHEGIRILSPTAFWRFDAEGTQGADA